MRVNQNVVLLEQGGPDDLVEHTPSDLEGLRSYKIQVGPSKVSYVHVGEDANGRWIYRKV